MKKQFTILFTLFIIVFAGCSTDNDSIPKYKINSEELITNYDKEFQFTIDGNPENIQWSSSDEKVGSIDQNGLFIANRIGTTIITGKIGSATVKSNVTVKSYGEFFKEPILDFGTKASNVKSKESRSLLNETSTALIFKGENNRVKNVIYLFENELMKGASITFEYASNIGTLLGQYYGERYTYLGQSDDMIMLDNNKGSIIGITINSSLDISAIYIPSNSVQATSAIMSVKKGGSLKSKMKELIQ